MRKIMLLVGLGVFAASTLLAQTQTPRTNTRQKAQRVRIAEGKQNGEITNKEAVVLNHQQRNIRRAERRAKADGQVTPTERVRLERKQDKANRTIRRAKHNEVVNQK